MAGDGVHLASAMVLGDAFQVLASPDCASDGLQIAADRDLSLNGSVQPQPENRFRSNASS